MPNIICRGLSFGYDSAETDLFTDLDLIIDSAWRTALVGRNGRGKTTLLRLLAGRLEPQAGVIERPLECRLFSETDQHREHSAWHAARTMAGPFDRWEREIERLLAENSEAALVRYGELESRYRARGGYRIDALLERELDLLGIEPAMRTRPLAELSGGEQTRCLLAGLFALDNGFPLIDEPTNHLDQAGRQRLADYLAQKPGFLLVSHDRVFLDAAVDHVVALNPDSVETLRTGYSVWRQAYRARLAEQARANEALRKDIRRFEATAASRRQGADAREADKTAHGRPRLPSERGGDTGFIGSRAARQMKRAIAAERRAGEAADARRESLVDVEKHYPLKLTPADQTLSQNTVLLRATNLVAWRPGSTPGLAGSARAEPLFDVVSFKLLPGERLVISGSNGSGKTTLLNLLAGQPVEHQGVLERPGQVRTSRVCQRPRWQQGQLGERLRQTGLDEARFRQIMAALGVRGTVLDQPLAQLSQGQLKKIELARSFIEPAHLLIWDEPLNYIDVDTREQIETVLLECSQALVCVEHDAHFVEHVATSVIHLTPCGDGGN